MDFEKTKGGGVSTLSWMGTVCMTKHLINVAPIDSRVRARNLRRRCSGFPRAGNHTFTCFSAEPSRSIIAELIGHVT